MTATRDKSLERTCVRLRKDDCEKLRKLSKSTDVGLNKVIRRIVHAFVETEVRRREARGDTEQDAYTESLRAIGIEPGPKTIPAIDL